MFGLEDDVIVEYVYNQLEERVRLWVVCVYYNQGILGLWESLKYVCFD
jgi:hypothetical protein